MEPILAFGSALAAIVLINLMLSGDNAIVIALAARSLPAPLQKRAIAFGAIGAVVVRSAMTLAVVWLLQIPGLLLAGGVALIWIGYRLLVPDESVDAHGNIGKPRGIWGAIRTIVIADMVMGVDNVLAVAGAAHGSYVLVVLGLITSVPIVMWGSTWLLKVVERFPAIVYVGSGVLLWTAARMIVDEPLVRDAFEAEPVLIVLLYAVVVLGVLWAGFVRNHRHLESRIHARLAQLAEIFAPDVHPTGGSMNRVLVPVSDLPNSHHALERVITEYRRNPSLEIHVLNVRRPLSQHVARFVRRSLREDYHRERAELALEPARKLLDRQRVPFQAHMRVGDVARVIVAEAQKLSCDHIVMSTARKGSLTRMLEDSTTERVLQLTHVPVELVVGNAVSKAERFGIPAAIVVALAAAVAAMMAMD